MRKDCYVERRKATSITVIAPQTAPVYVLGMFASIRPLFALLLLGAASAPLAAQRFHRLPATASTVAYGYYSAAATVLRSEEHTSELQSRGQLVCRLLLEKKKRDREEIDSRRSDLATEKDLK